MANDPAAISKFLALNVAALRTARGLSQSGLARLAGVPRSTVTYLESGEGNPSLQNLIRIAGSLQISIEELLARPRAACKLVRASDVPAQKRSQGMATLFKLLPDPIPGMEMDRMEIAQGGRMGGVPHTPHTKEYLVCVEGTVKVFVAGEAFSLDPGDVLAFPGDQPHSYQNVGRGIGKCLSVVVIAPHGV